MKKLLLLSSLLTASAGSFGMEQPPSEQMDPGYAIGLCLFEQEVNKSIEKAESFYEAARMATWWYHSFCSSAQIFFKDRNFIRSIKEKLLTKFKPYDRNFNFAASEAFSNHINFVDFSTHDRAISSLPEEWKNNPTSDDYKRMKEIFTQNYSNLVNGASLDYLDYEFDRLITHTGDTIKVIRDDQKSIMGFVTFRTYYPTIVTTHINLLAVDKQHQKQGYGKRLVEYVAQLAKSEEFQEVHLLAHPEAVGFYEKIGFTKYAFEREPGEYVKNIV